MPLQKVCPEDYDLLLAEKTDRWQPVFTALGGPTACIFASPKTGYRLRAEFRMWHQGENIHYVMFDSEHPKNPIVISDFPVASQIIQEIMEPLRERLEGNQTLRRKLFQVEFLSTLSGDLLITLIYHRPLDDLWQKEATALAEEMGISIIGRSRKQKIIIGRDWVTEILSVHGSAFHFKQPEGAFTQPNGRVNQHMLEWATSRPLDSQGDLLELYCGVGNFTLPLSHHFNHVLATELSKTATYAAIENLALNGLSNVEFARLSAEEMTQALKGDRAFRRLAHLPHPLGEYQLGTLLVDPPRAGLDPATLSLAEGFDHLMYISCNPDTLTRDLKALSSTHELTDLAFFDQFPYTPHLEIGTVLRRRLS
jgi:tRNA (uracil-5-)-methyltransferase